MQYLLAALPILAVLALMLLAGWSGQKAGPAGWLVALAVAALAFGLTPEVFVVSQLKGMLLSLFVLAVLWPALLLYNVVDRMGGIRAMALGLESALRDRGLLLLVMAWAFSGALEGLAGFGLPIAIVSPMLVGLGVAPVIAVAAVAVGHAWSVTFGDMGVIYQSLVAVSQVDADELAPITALMLGVACLACGLAAAAILGRRRRWPAVIALGALMAAVQYALAVSGLTPLAALGAGLAGVAGGILLSRVFQARGSEPAHDPVSTAKHLPPNKRALFGALAAYGGLAVLMTLIAVIPPVKAALDPVLWRMPFPQVQTSTGHITPAGFGQTFRILTHPGASILLVALASYLVFRRRGMYDANGGQVTDQSDQGALHVILKSTWRSAAPSSAGILAMVGLSALMEHCGMTLLLAQGLAVMMGSAFPLVSPAIGILGAFATGSNTASNVLFAPLQKNAALLLSISPLLLLAAQTAGGSLGSMVAPAKIIVGCSTVGLKGREGEVLRRTLPYGLLIGLGLGVLTFVLSRQ